jgi:hypothetical protein
LANVGLRHDRFETSFAPRYVTPLFGLTLPSSSGLGSVGWQRCNNTSSLQHQQHQHQQQKKLKVKKNLLLSTLSDKK